MSPRAALRWREGTGGEPAHDAFLATVFGMAPLQRALPPPWRAFGLFERDGRCVAAAETAALTLLLDGAPHRITALRLVGVVADRRGEGLFRRLMERVLREADGAGAILLYAAEPALYERFGFVGVPQHAFVAAPPPVAATRDAQSIRLRPLRFDADAALVRRLLSGRTAVSGEAALLDAAGLAWDRLAADRDLRLAYLPEADALLVHEERGAELVLVDVAAATMPSLPAILGALPRRYARVRALFPPDRLGWRGEPRRDDTGLMARGLPAPQRAFRLSPTAEF